MRWLPLVNHALSDPLVRYYVKHKAGMATHVPAVLVKCVPHDNKALAPAAACTIRLIGESSPRVPRETSSLYHPQHLLSTDHPKSCFDAWHCPWLQPPLEEGSDVTG